MATIPEKSTSPNGPERARVAPLRRIRVSIGGMIGLVALAALGFAAIRVASPAWAGALTSLTFFAMVASLLGIVFGRGSRRVFWTGFASLGWAYLFLANTSWFAPSPNPMLGPARIGQFFLAPALSPVIYDLLHSVEGSGFRDFTGGMRGGMGGMGGGMGGMGGGMRSMAMGGAPLPPPSVDPYDFLRIGRSLEALLWAFLGGWTARYFASGRTPSGGDDALQVPADRGPGQSA